MKRSLGFICLLVMIAILITATPILRLSDVAPVAFAQAFATKPLYRYQSARGQYLYTTDSKLPPGLSDGPWENEGVVCHVAKGPNHEVQTTPVYQLAKSDDFGVHYFYTNKSDEADTAEADGWTKQGIGFHVSPKQVPGTVPLYRLYKPVVPAKQKDKSWLDKIGEFIAGPEFTEAGADVLQDAHFYTIRQDELSIASKSGFNLEGRIGYVWETPYPPPAALAPDLIVQHTQADDTSVTVVLRNQGTANTGGVKYEVALSVYDDKNNFLYKLHQPAPGLSPNQSSQVKFDTGGKSLMAKRYQVKVDETNAVEESNEDNNETDMLSGPPLRLKVPAPNDSGLIPLVLDLKSYHQRTQQAGGAQLHFADFVITIANAKDFPKEAFAPLTILPAEYCGAHESNARLFAMVGWGREGKDTAAILKGACIPLSSPAALASMSFSIPEEKGDVGLIRVEIRDRLTNLLHQSQIIKVGAFGVAEVLVPLGCYEFLGRPDDFYCKNKTAMAACENLQKKGKPIKCRITTPKP